MKNPKKPASTLRPIADIQLPLQTGTARKRPASRVTRIHLKTVGVLLLLVVVVVFVRSYIQTRNELRRSAEPEAAVYKQASGLASEVGKFLELPAGETPTVATVKEASKLQTQPFFKNAQNGDTVLIYPKAGRAVLYRPSTKKVIEYAPVSLDGSAQPNP